jgi:hypothetical protein
VPLTKALMEAAAVVADETSEAQELKDDKVTAIVHATILSYRPLPNPQLMRADAPSEANPWPQSIRRRRYPSSANVSLSGDKQNQPTNAP